MDQAPSLPDALLKASSALKNFLSQVGGAKEGESSEDLFSNLVSENTVSQKTQTAQSQTAATQTATAGAQSVSSASPTSTPLTQTVKDARALVNVLHKILIVLRHDRGASQAKTDGASAGAQTSNQTVAATQGPSNAQTAASAAANSSPSQSSSDATASASNAAQPTAGVTQDAVSATSDAQTSSTSSDEAQALADIVAELLALMQSIMHILQQNQAASGTSAQDGAAAVASADAANALMSGLQTSSGDGPAADQAAERTDSSAGSTDPLLDLFKAAEKNAEQLINDFSQTFPTEKSAGAAVSDVALAPSIVSDVIEKLSQLSTDIKKVVDTQQQQAKPAVMAETTPTDVQNSGSMDQAAQTATVPLVQATTVSETAPPSYAPPLAKTGSPPLVQSAPTAAPAVPVASPTPSTAPAAEAAAASMPTPAKAAAPQVHKEDIESTATGKSEEPSDEPIKATAALTATPVQTADASASAGSSSDDDSHSGTNGQSSGAQASSAADPNATLGTSANADNAQATGTYSFASTLSAFRASHGGTTGLPSVVDQVILQMNRNVKNGQSQMSLQLHPADLGKITVKLEFGEEGRVQGTVVAENPKTLEMLQKDSRSLERALQDAGLRAEPGSLQFSLGGQKNPNNSGTASGGNSGAGSGDGTVSAGDAEGTEIADLAAISESYYITPTGVNIQV